MEIYIIVKVLEQQLGKLYLPLATTLPIQLPKLVAELLEYSVEPRDILRANRMLYWGGFLSLILLCGLRGLICTLL